MILTCPSCGTQYAVKDGAIPEGGRKVRCAACGHSWHQDPDGVAQGDHPQTVEPQAPLVAESADAPQPEPAPAAPADGFEHVPGEAEARGYAPGELDAAEAELVEPPSAVPVPPPGEEAWPLPGTQDDQWDPEKEVPDREEIEAAESETGTDRKRNWRMAAVIALVLVVAIVAALWFVAPDSLRQRIGFTAYGPTPLQIAPGTPERQKLASGNEVVVVSGRVINPSPKAQPVPPIRAELRDKSGRLLYAWEIAPPARNLAPGASATFNSAEMNVPPSGLDSTVTLTLKG